MYDKLIDLLDNKPQLWFILDILDWFSPSRWSCVYGDENLFPGEEQHIGFWHDAPWYSRRLGRERRAFFAKTRHGWSYLWEFRDGPPEPPAPLSFDEMRAKAREMSNAMGTMF